eukprot:TRINITY_DN69105_c0_g1_i1.p1 TRINITY_DN69105_c0_g1~~TRINITY_DN69105_c0_g1_i1.p1  ORF type:complete len:551 (-),score=91.17 TRINITY_DN69105_c0_g1_i1:277-1902(-)
MKRIVFALVFCASVAHAGFTPTSDVYVAPKPSPKQLRLMDWQWASFVHFGPTSFLPHNEDNNCVTTNSSTHPLAPVSAFDPAVNSSQPIDTDQWVETLVSMGTSQICLTVHHSGGFTLWPTAQKPTYTIAHSPYGKRFPGADLVRSFVESCRKYKVATCFYIAPQVDCDMAMLSETQYMTRMKGMLTELLTHYGSIDRLWLDTIWAPFNSYPTTPTPSHSFGTAHWRDLLAHIHDVSPNTTTLPGTDGCEVNSDYSYGRYPFATANVLPPYALDARLPDASYDARVSETCWTVYGGNGVADVRNIYAGPPQPVYFKVGEDMNTILRTGQWFLHPDMQPVPWSAEILAAQYAATVLRGLNSILNVPPDASGQIPAPLVTAAKSLGENVRKLNGRSVAARAADAEAYTTVPCPGGSVAVDVAPGSCVNAVRIAEDLATTGQVVTNYTVAVTRKRAFPSVRLLPPAPVPGPAFGQFDRRGGQTIGVQVVDIYPTALGAPYCDVDSVVVTVTGCLADAARLRVDPRAVDPSPLGYPGVGAAPRRP